MHRKGLENLDSNNRGGRSLTKRSVVLSIDLESVIADVRSGMEGRVKRLEEESVHRLLSLLDRHGQEATFFVVSEHFGDEVVQEIHSRGHEIASHSLDHSVLPKLGKNEVVKNISESKRVLEETIGDEVLGFRAPFFKRPDKLFSILEECGYFYDSSTVPSIPVPGWYGGDGVREPHRIDGIYEAPIAVSSVVRIPISGFWMRLFGKRWASNAVSDLTEERQVISYFHPYELIDVGFRTVKPWRRNLRTGEYVFDFIEGILDRHGSSRLIDLLPS